MIKHPVISVLIVAQQQNVPVRTFCSYLQTIKHVSLIIKESLPDDLGTFDVIVTAELSSFAEHDKQLGQFVRKGGGWLHLVDLSEKPLPEIFGVRSTNVCASSEVRVLFQDKRNPLAKRLPDAFYASGMFQGLEIIEDDTETILYADWHYTHKSGAGETPGRRRFCCLYNPAGF